DVVIARLVEVDAERLNELRLRRGDVVVLRAAAGDAHELVGTCGVNAKEENGRRNPEMSAHRKNLAQRRKDAKEILSQCRESACDASCTVILLSARPRPG